MQLTPEQEAVVAHKQGPAVVYAVAGAGKTTTLALRLARMAREGSWDSRRVLVCSFSKASVVDLGRRFAELGVPAGFEARTLHSLSYQILSSCGRLGQLPDPDAVARQLWREVLAELRKVSPPLEWLSELEEADAQDFLDWMGAQKARLAYPGPKSLPPLPQAALARISMAEAPEDLPWYGDLYRAFEHKRRSQGRMTLDDLVLEAWEVLVSQPSVLLQWQGRFDQVLCDEYQDLSLAQAEILDLLAAKHKNLMVVGDDDQAIYGWRGASPDRLLTFAERHGAQAYLLRDNFRSPLGPLALANALVRHNTDRQPKETHGTRGWLGTCEMNTYPDARAQADGIVGQILMYRSLGREWDSMAVLWRGHAQAPAMEVALRQAEVPYILPSGQPFETRSEIDGLLAYLRVGMALAHARSTGNCSPVLWERLSADLDKTMRFPRRYLPKRLVRAALDLWKESTGASLASCVRMAAQDFPLHWGQKEKVLEWAGLIAWLEGLDLQSALAADTLARVAAETDYLAWLRKSSGFAEQGEAKAAGVRALVNLAREGRNSVAEFLIRLKEWRARVVMDQPGGAVQLRTLHSAKGLEWPVVFVPDLNEGSWPAPGRVDVAEERRLLYVGLTRPKEHLHLSRVENARPSRFLAEIQPMGTAAALERARALAALVPAELTWPDLRELGVLCEKHVLWRELLVWGQVRGRVQQSHVQALAGRLLDLAVSLQNQGESRPWRSETMELLTECAGRQGCVYDLPLEPVVEAPAQQIAPVVQGEWAAGKRVHHPRFGAGEILPDTSTGGRPTVRVRFEDGEVRTLILRHAVPAGLRVENPS